MIDFKNSYVIIGGVGAGKSLISRHLQEKVDLPVITTDLLRHCPKTLEEINSRLKNTENEIIEIQNKLNSCTNPAQSKKLEELLAEKKNDCWVLYEQRFYREKMPDLPNYHNYGYNGDVSNYLRKNFGMVAWHYYQKQFEQLLLEDICKHYNGPAILDMGGGMAISLDQDYLQLHNKFKVLAPTLYAKYFTRLDKIGFDRIQNVMQNFNNVIYLKLPEDYSNHGTRAMHDKLNPLFISSHQFDELATKIIDVSNLFNNNQINMNELNKITTHIQTSPYMGE